MAYDFTSSATAEPFQDHPDYVTGMAHLQAGRWQQALELFQKLQTIYPDESELKRLLEDTQMRATTARFQPKQKSGRTASQSLSRLSKGIFILLLVAAGVYLVYIFWLGPLVAHEWRAFQVTELRNEADEAIALGDYAQARQALQQLQTLLPEDPETAAALTQIEQIEQTTQLYEAAKLLIAAKEWDQAHETLLELQNLDAQYRDLPQLMGLVQESQGLEKQFQAAESVFAQGDWPAAIAQYEALHQTDLIFRYEDIQARLFESHLKYAQSFIERVGTDSGQIAEAETHLTEALKLRPIDQEALGERDLLKTYKTALATAERDEAITLLHTIYQEQPAYAGQAAVQQLYTLLLERAAAFLAVDDQPAAIADYQLAVELTLDDTTEAQEHLTRLTDGASP